ncbi:lipase member H-B-like isoform X2 [Epargyreus clarus]|uniref:lipase member H-B-like isoform X2 n=1 Tax=Epargyreus clarus TaxID=520877 RepID=UPI003C2B46A1
MGLLLHFVISVVYLITIDAQEKNDARSTLQRKLYSDEVLCDHNRGMNLDVNDTMVYFYDFQNNFTESFKVNDAFVGLTSSYHLNVTRKFIFFVMGYKANITWSSSNVVTNTFRNVPNIYLMMVDHSVLGHKGGKRRNFENSIMHSYYVGRALGRLLSQLHGVGIPSRNIYCIGSSLGAQILGYAGHSYMKETREKIWRITGLDPAGPCFSNSDVENQLRSGLADYVEVYHCNAGVFGTSSVLADIDVFVNDGRNQPYCHVPLRENVSAQCSHQSCLMYWIRSVERSDWLALACDSYEDFITGKCVGNEVATVGYFNPGNSTGVFYATTEFNSPKKE